MVRKKSECPKPRSHLSIPILLYDSYFLKEKMCSLFSSCLVYGHTELMFVNKIENALNDPFYTTFGFFLELTRATPSYFPGREETKHKHTLKILGAFIVLISHSEEHV